MLAWLLHLHGVWIGKGRVTQAVETNPQVVSENQEIKQFLRGADGTDFKARLEALVKADGAWLIKTALLLEKQDLLIRHYPDAIWLLPFRPFEDCVASKMRHPGMKGRGEAENIARTKRHFDLQYSVKQRVTNWLDIDADRLCGGGKIGALVASQIFDFIGIEFDPAIYHDWVQPERWHNA